MIRTAASRVLILSALLAAAIPATTAGGAGAPSLEQSVLDEINLLRTRPADYIPYLQALKPHFQGKRLVLAGIGYKTREGVATVDEAIAYLSSARPLPPLSWSPALARAAADHVADQARRGGIGHGGSDGSRPAARIRRYGEPEGKTGEGIAYGFCGPTTGRTIVLQLLVDDGVANRAHRAQLFEPAFRLAGIACGTHPRYGNNCVIEYAAGYTACDSH